MCRTKDRFLTAVRLQGILWMTGTRRRWAPLQPFHPRLHASVPTHRVAALLPTPPRVALLWLPAKQNSNKTEVKKLSYFVWVNLLKLIHVKVVKNNTTCSFWVFFESWDTNSLAETFEPVDDGAEGHQRASCIWNILSHSKDSISSNRLHFSFVIWINMKDNRTQGSNVTMASCNSHKSLETETQILYWKKQPQGFYPMDDEAEDHQRKSSIRYILSHL